MRIIRHLTPGGPAYAALMSDGSTREIAGDILGEFALTHRAIKPGKRLAAGRAAETSWPSASITRSTRRKAARECRSGRCCFSRERNTLQNPGDPIEIPVKLASSEVDFECELCRRHRQAMQKRDARQCTRLCARLHVRERCIGRATGRCA